MIAQKMLSKGIMGNAELTAHQCIELPPPKNNAQREHLQLDQSLELKRDFVIFANKGGSKCEDGCIDHASSKKNCRGCSRHTCFASASEKNRERPHLGIAA
jgi:hypothetical protein